MACARDLPDGAAFCPACGAAQSLPACTGCGAELTRDAAFCFRCGTPVRGSSAAPASAPAGSAERRLSSVLFADLVSYTTLSESRDTEDVRELLTQYFDVCSTVIRRYGGVVEKFIGDAVMAVWGVPTAHEDDAERAVRAALDLVASVADLGERVGIPALALRAGVVTGEVAANLGATDQGMVAGDPVNTAARVQGAAEPGEVWVDESTRSMTAAAVTYTDTGEHMLKGKAEPARLYRANAVIAAVGGAQRVDGLEAPLTGREREMRLLKELFHSTEESGRPRLVVLDGEAGVGKSRLGWEFEKYIDGLSSRVCWHRGRCLSYGEGVAFWALTEAVRGRVGLVEEDAGEVVLDGLDRVLAERVPDDTERAWLRPRVASLLGDEGREFQREDLFAAWTRFFDRIGGTDPVVLLIEDAQHADEGLLDFIDHLVANSTTGCFVLMLARPELLEQHPQLGGRRATPIRVESLPAASMERLIDGLVDGLPNDVRDGLVVRAEGIPLFAVETVRALIDRDVVQPMEGRYVVVPGTVVDLSTIGAPASLHALVAARLDALSPAERRVLTDASVLGESFTRDGIGILAGDIDGLDAVLASLQRKELIVTDLDRFSAERGQFRFVQSVVRQVAYSTLSRRDRKSRHLLVAEHLAGDSERADELAQVIARHLLDAAEASAADDPDLPELRARAGELMLRAAERAAALGAYADAVRCHEVALTCVDDPHGRAHVLTLQAMVLTKLGRGTEAVRLAASAANLFDSVGDAVAAAGAVYHQTRALTFVDDLEGGLQLARARLAGLDRLTDAVGLQQARGRLYAVIATCLIFLGRNDEVEEPMREALRISDLVDDPEMFRIACNALALSQTRTGSQRVAIMVFDGMAQIAREREDWTALATALGNSGVQYSRTDLSEAIRLTEASQAAEGEHGLPLSEPILMNLLSYTWLAGDWDRTLEVAAIGAETARELPLAQWFSSAVCGLCAWAGRPVPVPALTEAGDTTAFQSVHAFAQAAHALQAGGDLRRALEWLRSCVREEAAVNGPVDDLHTYWPLAMRVAIDAADGEALAELWALREMISTQLAPTTSLRGHVQVFAALLAMGQDGSAEEVESGLRQGIEILDRCGVAVWRAHAQEDLGRWLLDQGRAQEAQQSIEAARATYEQLGATTWLARLNASTQHQYAGQ